MIMFMKIETELTVLSFIRILIVVSISIRMIRQDPSIRILGWSLLIRYFMSTQVPCYCSVVREHLRLASVILLLVLDT